MPLLTRIFFVAGLLLVVVALLGRAWLARPYPRGDVRVAVRGEDVRPNPLVTPIPGTRPMTSTPEPNRTPTPAAVSGKYTIVRQGDTLAAIALRFNVTPYALAQLNGLPLNIRLYPGQILRLPDDAVGPTSQEPLPVTVGPALPAATATPVPAPPRPLPTEVIRADWPERMPLDRSETVRLTLGQAPPPVQTAVAVEIVVTATIAPVRGTPAAPLNRAFGGDYAAVAIARLAAAGFDKDALKPDEQPLDAADLTWVWSILPKRPGVYPATVNVEVVWTPRGGGSVIRRDLWQTDLEIEVVQPWFTIGQFNIMGLLGSSFVIGSLVSFLRQLWQKRRAPPGGGASQAFL